jgi:hypothetical protein
LSGFTGKHVGVGREVAMDVGRQLYGELDGLSSAMVPSFSFAMYLSASVWFEHEVAIDDYPHRKTRPDCQGRLNVEIAPNDLLAGLVQGIPCPTAKRL